MAIRNGAWLPALDLRDAAAQIDDWNDAQRDEIASQRAADAHLIYDERRP